MNKYCLLVMIGITSLLFAHSKEYTFKLLVGNELQNILPFMAQQRMAVFRDYPYLYEGNPNVEHEYLKWFASLPHSSVIMAYLDGKPIGWISGTGFADFDVHFKGSNELLKKNGYDSRKFYYIPEAIIVSEHRDTLLLEELHTLIAKHAKTLHYSALCFAEESHEQHPLKPADYKGLEELYRVAGYTPTQMIITFSWLTIQADGSVKDEEHELCYWIKELAIP